MRAIPKTLSRSAFVLALSMSALPNLVNAQAQSLTSVNKANNSSKSDLKDSVKDANSGASKLIETVLRTGIDSSVGKNLAPIIGLPGAMSMKKHDVVISENGNDFERRACWVIYENSGGPDSKVGDKRSLLAYVLKAKRTGLDNQIQYFRIDPNGKLQKAILSRSKVTADGKGVRGSGAKTDLDVDSPEVRKTFEAEMNFWLKDWLKNEQKNAAKKTADAGVKTPSTTAL